MLVHPAFRTVFARQYPLVRCLDTADDATAQTTYTFSSMSLGDLGGTASVSDTYGTNPGVRAGSRKFVAVIVHGKNDAAVFSVSGVTLGGVAGTSVVDRGGVTNAINTAIFTWSTESLGGITDTDVAVTWSEEVLGCAVGVVLVENIGIFSVAATGSGTGTGNLPTGTAVAAIASNEQYFCAIQGTTCITGGGTENVGFFVGVVSASANAFMPQTMLYAGTNAVLDYAAAWTYNPQYSPPLVGNIHATWSGTGAGDAVVAVFY